jgi:hypothetical protein
MIHALTIAIILLLVGCSLRSTYPTLGGIIGGSAGSLGGPGSAALGAGAGVLAGEALKNADKLVEAEEKIEALTHGDVSELVAQGMAEHQSGFDQFTTTVKRWLMWAAVALGAYLAIPIFVARKCSRTEALKNQTRPPFPIK